MKPKNICIHKSKRTKNIRMTIKQDLILHIYVPMYYNHKEIERLIALNHNWIKKHTQIIFKQQQKIQELIQQNSGKFLFFGEWIEFEKQYTKKSIKALLVNYLEERVSYFSNLMKLSYSSIKVRYNKKVLGSCSFDNKLSFSLLLFFADISSIDYVVIHELAHIRYKNHSKNFWTLVEQFCPDFLHKRRALHSNVALYNAIYLKYFNFS